MLGFAVLAVWLCIAIASSNIAGNKGISRLGGFLLGAILGIIGLMIVLLMKNRSNV